MSNSLTPRPGSNQITSLESASVAAYDALEAAGHTDIELEMPHQTRGTWIVPATTATSRCHVHIDPRTGHTRISTATGD